MVKHAAINRKSNASSNRDRDPGKKSGLRSKATIDRLNMYKGGKPIRNKDGKIVGGAFMMKDEAGNKKIGAVARIAPDRRWFGNTRIIAQNELDRFREEVAVKEADPYSILLRRKKIPMALLQESQKVAKVNLLETESFDSVFGGKKTRTKPKLSTETNDYGDLLKAAAAAGESYEKDPTKDSNIELSADRDRLLRKDDLFGKGQSKRIWAELYKVLDCSDVVLEVVDARNVPGTRCAHIEKYIKNNAKHKHLVVVINKCDLVPSWVTRKWVKILSESFPTLAFHASITNSFGKGALISLLRQFGKLHSDRQQISVGVIGYPNTGKSSVINALIGKASCKAAPVPGETKVWQYIALTRKIYLIDCPGVVYDVGDDEAETVLKGVVRAERLERPSEFIDALLARVLPHHVEKQYNLKVTYRPVDPAIDDVANINNNNSSSSRSSSSSRKKGRGTESEEEEKNEEAAVVVVDAQDLLSRLALSMGRLLKGGEPDVNSVARIMLNDFQRGKLPYFVPPPRVEKDAESSSDEEEEGEKEGEKEGDDDDDDEGEEEVVEGDGEMEAVPEEE